MSDRALAIANARYIATSMADFGDDIEFREGGIMEQRANEVLDLALDLCRTSVAMGFLERSKKENSQASNVLLKVEKDYLAWF